MGATIADSVALIALLLPRVAVVVVAGCLPEARTVLDEEVQAANPLGALPEVQVGNQKSGRAAVLRLERLAVELVDDPGPPVGHVFERQVGPITVVAPSADVLGLG